MRLWLMTYSGSTAAMDVSDSASDSEWLLSRVLIKLGAREPARMDEIASTAIISNSEKPCVKRFMSLRLT
jgi:hypothetical protein